jgi:hypothetical protein
MRDHERNQTPYLRRDAWSVASEFHDFRRAIWSFFQGQIKLGERRSQNGSFLGVRNINGTGKASQSATGIPARKNQIGFESRLSGNVFTQKNGSSTFLGDSTAPWMRQPRSELLSLFSGADLHRSRRTLAGILKRFPAEATSMFLRIQKAFPGYRIRV